MHDSSEHVPHHPAPPWTVDDRSRDIARRDGDVGARVEGADEEVDDLDRDRQVRIQEHDRIAGCGVDSRAYSRALAAVRQAQDLEAQPEVRMRDLCAVERVRRGVDGPIVGQDDLSLDPAVAKELGASPEACLDATRLVIGR